MLKPIPTIYMLTTLLLTCCKESPGKQNPVKGKTASQTTTIVKEDSIVYQTTHLIIRKLSNHVYEHTSFLMTKDFGKVDCNGMLVIDEHEAIIFDTPAEDTSAEELITYLNKRSCKIKAVIPTHFHEDCVGGLETFNKYNIPCYASNLTIELLKNKGREFSKPIQGFANELMLHVGNKEVFAAYFGEGHTKDNIIGYFPGDKAIFGGCLIKELNAKKGNLEDANVMAWPGTVRILKLKFPHAAIVIPGHGEWGGTELFDYTIRLFE